MASLIEVSKGSAYSAEDRASRIPSFPSAWRPVVVPLGDCCYSFAGPAVAEVVIADTAFGEPLPFAIQLAIGASALDLLIVEARGTA